MELALGKTISISLPTFTKQGYYLPISQERTKIQEDYQTTDHSHRINVLIIFQC